MNPYRPYFMNYPLHGFQHQTSHQAHPYNRFRQPTIRGQATWTEGGQVTKCNIPWSENEYMTAAVGESSPFQCGETIKIRNLQAPFGREIYVKIVDEVEGYPEEKINLHRKAFEALGINPNVGIVQVEMTPISQDEERNWEQYILQIAQSTFPNSTITNLDFVRKSSPNTSQTMSTYLVTLDNMQRLFQVEASVTYETPSNRVMSVQLKRI